MKSKITNNKQAKYIEDVLQQDEFDAEEVLSAKHKHPIVYWFRFQWFMLADSIELEISKLIGRTRRLFKKLTASNQAK
jgi:hypothetical protein